MKRIVAISAVIFALLNGGLAPGSAVVAGPALATFRIDKTSDKADVCKLHGKVKFVDSFADYKIQIVDSFPDIKVKMVTSFPDDAGEWMVVDSFPDFTVQVVDSFPDFKVKYVESFPGCP